MRHSVGKQARNSLKFDPPTIITTITPSIDHLDLTRRETDILAWVTRGKTNSEIGKILSISPRTVGKHLEHIYQKLGVETRTAAAIFTLASDPKLKRGLNMQHLVDP
jgi:DNA-binding CsgD family transcriptional regulator